MNTHLHIHQMVGNKEKNGYTLIELLVVATIIAILTTIAIVTFTGANTRARDGKRKADLEQVRAALELYRSDPTQGGIYPPGNFTTAVDSLNSAGYLSQPLPKDPKDVDPYTYMYSQKTNGGSYCLCAQLESGTTNGNSTNTDCNFAASGLYYCVVNP